MNGDLAHQLGLEERHLQVVLDLLNRSVSDRTVYAFGSRAFGQARRSSNLELAGAGETPLRAAHRWDLMDAFDESMLPIEVDVVDLNDVDVSFRSRIEPDFLLIKEQGEVTL